MITFSGKHAADRDLYWVVFDVFCYRVNGRNQVVTCTEVFLMTGILFHGLASARKVRSQPRDGQLPFKDFGWKLGVGLFEFTVSA
jgi:hypothetical protein